MTRAICVFVSLAAIGCTEAGEPALVSRGRTFVPTGELSFAEHVSPILEDYCSDCHVPGGQGEAYFVIASVQGLEDAGVVDPCDHRASALWLRIDDGTMPQGGAKLSQIEIDTIAKWIDQGGQATFDDSLCPNPPLD